MKLSPLLLFLLLVLILVISVVVFRSFEYPLEGFVSYNVNVLPSNTATIQAYSSSPVIKMFDNLFFDNKNGNVIEVDSSRFLGNVNSEGNYMSGNIDSTGASITNLYISTRDGSQHTYPKSTANIPEGGLSTVTSSYNNWTYNTKCQNTGKYELFYIPWNSDTYIHIIEKSYTPAYYGESPHNPSNVYTYKFSGGSSAVSAVRYVSSPLPINAASTTSEPGVNTFVYDSYYGSNRLVYKLSSAFEFDASNGNLIFRTPNTIKVYGRSQNVIMESNHALPNAGLSNTIPSVNYIAWVVNDANNTSQLVYVANGTNTLLLVINKNTSGSYDLANVARFNSNGLDNGNANTAPGPAPGPPVPPVPGPLPDISGNAISDYYKWYWYWNSVGGGNKYSDNYILKTQIVPPVCPKCPNCPDFSGACVNCGGQGGSGTVVDNGKSVINNTVSTVGNVAETTVDAAGNVISGAEKGLGTAVGGVASGIGSSVGGIATGVASVANTAITTAGSVANNLIDAPQNYGSSQGYAGSVQSGYAQPGFAKGSAPIDNYSYYGALPAKGANYMPITADFSKFGK
jgi:hypothetical protein